MGPQKMPPRNECRKDSIVQLQVDDLEPMALIFVVGMDYCLRSIQNASSAFEGQPIVSQHD